MFFYSCSIFNTSMMSYLILLFPLIKDIVTKAIARELVLEETPVSKIMTRNPIFVLSDTLAEEALQKMVLGLYSLVPTILPYC